MSVINQTYEQRAGSQEVDIMQKTLGLFTRHPASVDETYFEHFVFATTTGARLVGAGAAALIHGVLPFAFETTASRMMKQLHHDLTHRGNNADDEVDKVTSHVNA